MQEAALVCVKESSLRDVSGGSCAHAAAEAAQYDSVEWLLLTGCGLVQGAMRTYTDLRSLSELLAQKDGSGYTMLHRTLDGANGQADSDGGRQRARLACWLLQHGSVMRLPVVTEGSTAVGSAALAPERVVRHFLGGALLPGASLSDVALVRQAVGAPTEQAQEWMAAALAELGRAQQSIDSPPESAVAMQASTRSDAPLPCRNATAPLHALLALLALLEPPHSEPHVPSHHDHVAHVPATRLQVHHDAARTIWQQHAATPRPDSRGGLSYLQLWLENIDASEEAGDFVDGEHRYAQRARNGCNECNSVKAATDVTGVTSVRIVTGVTCETERDAVDGEHRCVARVPG